MSQGLGTGMARSIEAPPEVQESAESVRTPQLDFEKTGWLDQLKSSVTVLVHEPAAPKSFSASRTFEIAGSSSDFPRLRLRPPSRWRYF